MNIVRTRTGSLVGVLACLSVMAAALAEEPSKRSSENDGKQDASIYAVAKYDPERDATEDLATTVKRAQAEGKRIILEIGGKW